eukprot:GHVR01193189.1.p1 GENE.GHVR01193189.1~~GHVR01193189.1.p1  ORF type:complete len:114 (-),score=81.05 GHVR01193189.1:80-421(-)
MLGLCEKILLLLDPLRTHTHTDTHTDTDTDTHTHTHTHNESSIDYENHILDALNQKNLSAVSSVFKRVCVLRFMYDIIPTVLCVCVSSFLSSQKDQLLAYKKQHTHTHTHTHK